MEISEFREELSHPAMGMGAATRRFALNELGRDFVVGDIHGMFSHLEQLLENVAFDPARDRLFSVGDLVDRGPDSHRALEWLEKPWFEACRGNHEQFVIDSTDIEQSEIWVNFNGGEWWLGLDAEQQRRFREAFSSMPIALEVETLSGAVGIVHADVPPFLSWDRFCSLLDAGDRDAVLYALWSRNRISGQCSSFPVSGAVSRVYCGHTPTRDTVNIDNVWYIDTGAVYVREGYRDARLTMIQIHPEAHREYTVRTGA